jgi:hypothetical protein
MSKIALKASESGTGTVTIEAPVVEGNVTLTLPSATGAFLPPGMVAPFATPTAPDGWLACDGEAVSRSTYAGLYAALGDTWGAGDGSTTFNLPDLRAAVPQGVGANETAYRNGTDATDGYYGDDVNAGAGLAVGEERRDAFQDHGHDRLYIAANEASTLQGATLGGSSGIPVSLSTGNETSMRGVREGLGGAGPPRTGKDTQVYAKGVLYCVKY